MVFLNSCITKQNKMMHFGSIAKIESYTYWSQKEIKLAADI